MNHLGYRIAKKCIKFIPRCLLTSYNQVVERRRRLGRLHTASSRIKLVPAYPETFTFFRKTAIVYKDLSFLRSTSSYIVALQFALLAFWLFGFCITEDATLGSISPGQPPSRATCQTPTFR